MAENTTALSVLTSLLPAIVAHEAELNHLLTEATIAWARENLYIPTGVRGYGRDFGKGEIWVESMLRGASREYVKKNFV